MTRFIIPILIGFSMDLIFADPYKLPHIVVFMGGFINKMERFFKKRITNEVTAGGIVVVSTLLMFTIIPFVLLFILYKLSYVLGLFVESFICWQCLAAKGLEKESMKVYYALENEGLGAGRDAVSRIVGRDTEGLNEEEILKATVETISENTSDGVIAPLFYMAFGGGVMGCFYKAVNTMDSMIGYKNEEYIKFGRVAARLDDFINFVPARIAGILMVASAFLLGFDGKGAWRIFKRDRLNHASPNSAQTEAPCAGALGIMLAGDAWYFGKLYKKKTIGDSLRPIEREDIILANRLMYGTSFLMMGIICIIGIF